MANETTDVVILQIKIDEGTGKKLPQAKKEVEVLAGSIMGLSKANKELRAERNRVDLKTEEGRKKVQELNDVINKNNATIKQNTSALEKQRANVGNYTTSIKEALNNSGKFGQATVGLTENFAGLLNPITGAVAAVGGLLKMYASSVVGARDLAKAQDTLSAAIEITNESVGAFVDNLVDAEHKGMGFFETIYNAVLFNLNPATQALASYNAQVKDQLRDLEISRRSADADFKNDERKAELQRRIRDDTTKTLKERTEAARKIDEIMAAAGQRTTIVIQAQIDAIKSSTINYDQNREAQLRVKDLMLEIADVQEDVVGKTTENVTALAAIRKEVADKQKVLDDEQELRDRRKLATQEEISATEEFHLDRTQEIKEKEADIHKKFNERISKGTKERIKAIKDESKAEKEAAKELGDVGQLKRDMYSQIGMSIQQLAGKNKALAIAAVVIEKAAAIAQIISNTAIANAKAVAASPLTFGMPWVAINTGTAIAAGVSMAAQTATSISQINSFGMGGEFKPKKYAYGGPIIVGGRSHAAGGTTYRGEDGNAFEVEKGEGIYVMKKSAQEKIKFMSSFNQADGGRSWTGIPSWYAAQGGQIETRTFASQLQERRATARLIAQAVTSLPPQILTVEAFDAVANAKYNAERSVQILP